MAWIYNRTTDYNALDIADSQNNAQEFLDYFDGYMTLEAMAGILGNIYYECGGSINPGQMEHGRGGSTLYGYGMIQWTPGTVIINWATSHGGNWYDGAMQVYRIKCEGEGAEGAGGTWLPTTAYPYTWGQYCALLDVDRATKAYFYERERGTWNDLRLTYANYWFEWLTGQHPEPPTPPTPGTNLIRYGGARDIIRRLIIHE